MLRLLPILVCLGLTAAPAFGAPLDKLADALLRDGSYKVRVRAARALGTAGDRRAVAPLKFALRDDHPLVRAAAAHSLGQLADADAVAALCALRADKDDFVRRTTEHSLATLGGVGRCGSGGAAGLRVKVQVRGADPSQQAAVQRQLEGMVRARQGMTLIDEVGKEPGIELMVSVSSGVRGSGASTAVTCAMNQSVFDLPKRALRGTANPSAEVPLGADASPALIAGSQQQCVDALTGVVFDALVAYAERR
ncbi:MAG: HEAT repeat domain-containing protein [Myxococcales bacterium]|nr:HEAT repeat domain-containing protein [Myxococcales bacterium]MCB9525866.1 HEAT repeat domain-containing protein [Myxococcales bacterium]